MSREVARRTAQLERQRHAPAEPSSLWSRSSSPAAGPAEEAGRNRLMVDDHDEMLHSNGSMDDNLSDDVSAPTVAFGQSFLFQAM